MDAADDFGEEGGDRDDFAVFDLLVILRDRVSHDNFGKWGDVEPLDSRAGKDCVGGGEVDVGSTIGFQDFGRRDDGAGSVDHVIKEDGRPTAHITDNVLDFSNIVSGAGLMQDRKCGTQEAGKFLGIFGAASIRAYDDRIFEFLLFEVVEEKTFGCEIVDWFFEKTLCLR